MSPAAKAKRAAEPLRDPPFRRYWLAGLTSSTGTAMATSGIAAGVLQRGGGASGIAMVMCGPDVRLLHPAVRAIAIIASDSAGEEPALDPSSQP
ncbi:hypothetical protein ACQPZ8_01640 [Actinomadura nitritigenes]|uniref:hypothetical protein n=1 Tax=Actinomadura nitritigenes TaxID=134602 RepID=UPI003D9080F4